MLQCHNFERESNIYEDRIFKLYRSGRYFVVKSTIPLPAIIRGANALGLFTIAAKTQSYGGKGSCCGTVMQEADRERCRRTCYCRELGNERDRSGLL